MTNNFAHVENTLYIILILWIIPLFAYFVDFWTGIEGAKAQGQVLYSGGFRRTIAKIGEYWRFQLMALLVDVIGMFLPEYYTLPFISMVATISIILIEFISVKENFKKKKDAGVNKAIDISETILTEIIKAKTKYDAEKIIGKLNK